MYNTPISTFPFVLSLHFHHSLSMLSMADLLCVPFVSTHVNPFRYRHPASCVLQSSSCYYHLCLYTHFICFIYCSRPGQRPVWTLSFPIYLHWYALEHLSGQRTSTVVVTTNQNVYMYVYVDARILDNQLLPSSSRSDKFRTPHCLALSGLVGSSSVDSGANTLQTGDNLNPSGKVFG